MGHDRAEEGRSEERDLRRAAADGGERDSKSGSEWANGEEQRDGVALGDAPILPSPRTHSDQQPIAPSPPEISLVLVLFAERKQAQPKESPRGKEN